MTITFITDSNNDLYIDNFANLATASGLGAVLQACANAAKTMRGEMIYFVDQGMPNFTAVWNGSPNIQQFEAALRETLLNVDGVIDVPQMQTTVTGNVLSYAVLILTSFGSGTINGGL